MKPLACVTTFNRFELTQQTLTSLEPALANLELVIVDNGSEAEMTTWLADWAVRHGACVIFNPENRGCPRALNQALDLRRTGQAFIKLDNDLRVLSPGGWVKQVEQLVSYLHGKKRNVAMLSAYYEPWQKQRVVGRENYGFSTLWHIQPVVGHAVYHTPEFMDQVGFFDVLSDDHLYGFEDLILSHKATTLGWEMLAWEGWKIENIQRHSALGREGRDAHVEAMRPFYNARVQALALSWGEIYTGHDGQPGGME